MGGRIREVLRLVTAATPEITATPIAVEAPVKGVYKAEIPDK